MCFKVFIILVYITIALLWYVVWTFPNPNEAVKSKCCWNVNEEIYCKITEGYCFDIFNAFNCGKLSMLLENSQYSQFCNFNHTCKWDILIDNRYLTCRYTYM